MTSLSIIIPVYQVEPFIRPCLQSVYSQDLEDDTFEVILVNDGTVDNSMEVIEAIMAQHRNITVINQPNQGLSVARNNGIAAAKGTYILMPDSDDLLVEHSVRPLLEKALATKADLVVADFAMVNHQEILGGNIPTNEADTEPLFVEKSGQQLFMEDLMPNQYYVWRTLFRREFITSQHITFYPGIVFQDIPFTHECYLRAGRCLRTHWLMNIYRRGHYSVSSPDTFNMRKAHDFCIAIRQTWRLREMGEVMSPQLRNKLTDEVFISYENLFRRALYATKGYSNKVAIMSLLRQEVPDLRFTHGKKQRIHTLLLRLSPHLSIWFGMIVKRLYWHS